MGAEKENSIYILTVQQSVGADLDGGRGCLFASLCHLFFLRPNCSTLNVRQKKTKMNAEEHAFGNLGKIDFEVVRRDGKLYARYDAGSHHVQWREDEISEAEFAEIIASEDRRNSQLFRIQKRLLDAGVDAYKSNWNPK